MVHSQATHMPKAQVINFLKYGLHATVSPK
jgi:hypothetical protein